MKLKLTKEPVTRLACATRAPEPLGSLTWCYVPLRVLVLIATVLITSCSDNASQATPKEQSIQASGSEVRWGEIAYLDAEALKTIAPKKIKSTFPEVQLDQLFFDQIVINYSDHPDVSGYNYRTVQVRYYDLSRVSDVSPNRLDAMSYIVEISDNYPEMGSVSVSKGMFPFLPGREYLNQLRAKQGGT